MIESVMCNDTLLRLRISRNMHVDASSNAFTDALECASARAQARKDARAHLCTHACTRRIHSHEPQAEDTCDRNRKSGADPQRDKQKGIYTLDTTRIVAPTTW